MLANQGACRQPDTGCVGAQLHAQGRKQGRKTKAAGEGCLGKTSCSQAPSDVAMGAPLARSEAFLGTGHRASQVTGYRRCVCTGINAAQLTGSAEWRQVFGTALSTVRPYSRAAVVSESSLCILSITGDVPKWDGYAVPKLMLAGWISLGPCPQLSYVFNSHIPLHPSPRTKAFWYRLSPAPGFSIKNKVEQL